MTGAEIARLLILFGPIALDLIAELTAMWDSKMTVEQTREWVLKRRKSYDEYIAAERAKRLSYENPNNP
jgi:hypothetical protein